MSKFLKAINDQGKEFVNKLSTKLFEMTGTEQHITSAYHPQSNGLVERLNRTIKDSLIKSLADRSNWVECLPAVMFAYRTAKHESTRMTPFQIMYGRQAILPLEVQYNPTFHDQDTFESEETISSKIEMLLAIRERMFVKVASNIKNAQNVQKQQYDKRHRGSDFKVGDLVKQVNKIRKDRKGGRFTDRFDGPYIVARVLGKNRYKISNGKTVLAKLVNSSNLDHYNEPSP